MTHAHFLVATRTHFLPAARLRRPLHRSQARPWVYPAYNQTVNRMTRLSSGVEVGMERFGAVHTAAERDAAIVSIMRVAQELSGWSLQKILSVELRAQDRPLANQSRGIVRGVPSAVSLR